MPERKREEALPASTTTSCSDRLAGIGRAGNGILRYCEHTPLVRNANVASHANQTMARSACLSHCYRAGRQLLKQCRTAPTPNSSPRPGFPHAKPQVFPNSH